jgi:hypothetical protein
MIGIIKHMISENEIYEPGKIYYFTGWICPGKDNLRPKQILYPEPVKVEVSGGYAKLRSVKTGKEIRDLYRPTGGYYAYFSLDLVKSKYYNAIEVWLLLCYTWSEAVDGFNTDIMRYQEDMKATLERKIEKSWKSWEAKKMDENKPPKIRPSQNP